MKKSLMIAALSCFSLLTYGHDFVCSDTNGNEVKIYPGGDGGYYNLTLEINGVSLIEYFNETINDLPVKKCIDTSCRINIRFMGNGLYTNSARHDSGFFLYDDHEGKKLESNFNGLGTGKSWYFDTCK